MSEIKVNSIKGVGASAAAITVNNTDGTCTANITNKSNRNLVVNGSCIVAQRSTSATVSSNGYWTVDRFTHVTQGNDEQPTSAQVDVASGTTPYTLGFRKAIKITNGNQTSGAGTSDRVRFGQNIEAQDIANSGWNYTSSSSFITLSCWVKSSVAQNFYFNVKSHDGTQQNFPFETGSLTADTWTKITKTISGNSNLQFDNNTSTGFEVRFNLFLGTDFTANGTSLDTWAAYASGTHCPDFTSTWYTTNDATFEMTGLQIEVSSIATDFEHESFQATLMKCRRYCFAIQATDAPLGNGGAVTMSGNDGYIAYGQAVNGANPIVTQIFYPSMRSTPSLSDSGNQFKFWRGHAADIAATGSGIFTESIGCSPMHFRYGMHSGGGMTNGDAGILTFNGTGGYIIFSAEL